MIVLAAVLVINTAVSVLLFRRTENRNLLLLMLGFLWILPFAGILLNLGFLMSLTHKEDWNYDRESLVARSQLKNSEAAPHAKEELDVVPVADAMAASSSQAKRQLILSQMKRDLYKNYQELIPASSDEDSETAHYVSALRMEIYSGLQKEVSVSYEAWQNSQTGEDLIRVLEHLGGLVSSGLLSEYEKERQSLRFCALAGRLRQEHTIPAHLISHWMEALQNAGRENRILDLWKEQDSALFTEAGLCAVLEASLKTGRQDCFEELLNYTEEHPGSITSWKVQEKISYWNDWRKCHAVG